MPLIDSDHADIGTLLAWALRPTQRPGRNPEYQRVLTRYRTEHEFKSAANGVLYGLGAEPLSSGDFGLILGITPESPLAFRVSDMPSVSKPEHRLLAGLIVTGLVAFAYPSAQELAEDQVRHIPVGEFDTWLRDLCGQLQDHDAAGEAIPEEGLDAAWRIYLDMSPVYYAEQGRNSGRLSSKCTQFWVQAILTWLTIQLAEFRGHLRTQKGELTDALKKIEEVATHDALTGAYNRRYMQELLEHHARLSQRSARGFAVAVLDLDHFKRVNDTHGHAAGDNVLKGFALSVQQHLQDTEVLARWGGEEFLLLAPDAGAAELAQAIDRVRQTLSHAVLCAGVPDLRVGVSAGVAYLQAGETVPQVIERADRALYAAKAAGRGRTVVDGGSAPQGAAS